MSISYIDKAEKNEVLYIKREPGMTFFSQMPQDALTRYKSNLAKSMITCSVGITTSKVIAASYCQTFRQFLKSHRGLRQNI